MSTGKTKVVGNFELSMPASPNSAEVDGKVVQFRKALKGPSLAAHVWVCP